MAMKVKLTQEHCDCLTQAIQSASSDMELFEKLKRCGLPVDDLMQQTKQQLEQCQSLKREFFPYSP